MASSRLERIGTIFTRVEGLLTRGAMKPDDRPLWFDVYKAFPPITEPKFAKPKPEIKSIRPILYKEDILRAKFHSNGHGLGVVNMLHPTSETHTKKLLQQYKKLKAEGVPEHELIEKSAAVVENERTVERQEASKAKITGRNQESSAQTLAEADLKNIFKEN
ncbi:probable 28S ribosomal protein S23, mitochondrial [Galleria mellonella]|uniref:Small ribosomal subunit protein mS23 n=1 Tax=Galleria mellonella TaxID=7137 RepID=A0A6J1WFI3_GALME|nr:probable 28S ribosomal protein S23, mitochondrial [Galleria mellonella]